jgi:hypothetical protein
MAALSHGNLASLGTCRDGGFAQGHDKRDTVQSSIAHRRTWLSLGNTVSYSGDPEFSSQDR